MFSINSLAQIYNFTTRDEYEESCHFDSLKRYADSKNCAEYFGNEQCDHLHSDNVPANPMVYVDGSMTYILCPDGNHLNVTGKSSLQVSCAYDETRKRFQVTP